MQCKYCKSKKVDLTKVIYRKSQEGKPHYHYRLNCLKCNKKYLIKRTKEVFEEVKDKSWDFSVNARRVYNLPKKPKTSKAKAMSKFFNESRFRGNKREKEEVAKWMEKHSHIYLGEK